MIFFFHYFDYSLFNRVYIKKNFLKNSNVVEIILAQLYLYYEMFFRHLKKITSGHNSNNFADRKLKIEIYYSIRNVNVLP